MGPYVDLHVHLRGTMQPHLAMAFATRNCVALPSTVITNNRYSFSGFSEFLEVYNSVGHVIRRADDLKQLAETYLRNARDLGTIYVEFMLSPSHSIENGIPFEQQLDAIASASAHVPGISCSIVLTCVRHRGAEEAMNVAELAAKSNHPLVRGFGLTGNELKYDVEDFANAFKVAKDAGLGLTAHVGEWGSADSIVRAVQTLGLSRIGHGIAAATCPAAMDKLAKMNVTFEICQSANLALGAVDSKAPHPIGTIVNAGCKVALGTDDPEYFATTIHQEYEAARALLSPRQMNELTANAIASSFCDENAKTTISRRASDLANGHP